MATNRTFYVDDDNSWRIDSDGARNHSRPKLKYGDRTPWALKIRSMLTGTIANANWADAATFRAAVGDDFSHSTIDGALTADRSGAVTTMPADGFSSAPPAAGFLTVTNGAGQTEQIYYSAYAGTWASAATELTFAVNVTLAYAYLNNDDCDADASPPMVKTGNASIVSTGKATGDFTVTLDALNNVFKNALGTEDQIDAYLEFVGIDGSGYEIHSIIIPIFALNAVDPGGAGSLTPSTSLIPKILTLTSAPNYNTTLASLDPTAAVGSWGVFGGMRYEWYTAALNHSWPVTNAGY